MFDFLFDLPLVIVGPAIILSLCAFALSGLAIFDRYILPRMKFGHEESAFTSAMIQAVMIFYGLAVALVAVNVWGNHSEAARTISQEASAVASLYRDVSSYPEPVRSELTKSLRDYLDYVINQAWPLQRKGKIPIGGVEEMNRFQAHLTAFEPATEGQKLVHAETLRAYNHMIEARRLRLDAVLTGLPAILWWVVIAGALVGISSTFFFRVEDSRLERIQVALLTAFVGLVIVMIFALDRPFRGDLGLDPSPYQLVYDQLMTP